MGKKIEYDINRMTRIEYCIHWIKTLVSHETKEEQTFFEWITGFEDRYSQEELELMNKAWKGY